MAETGGRDGGRIRISITVAGLGRLFGPGLEGLVESAVRADRAGVDQWVMTDHLAMGVRTDRYPYGRFPFPAEEPWPEPLTTLAGVAGATRRMRLGTGVLIAPLRPPLLLAKTVATLDVLSGGRVDLGVGTGWQPEEFEAAGVPFPGRGERMMETLRACRALWAGAPARFRGEHAAFQEIASFPLPVQAGGPPLWFGLAPTPRNVARIAELGVGWMPIGSNLGAVREGAARIREAFASAGRDPDTLQVRMQAPLEPAGGRPDLDAALAGLPRLWEAGITHAAFALAAFARRPEEVPPLLDRLGAAGAGPA